RRRRRLTLLQHHPGQGWRQLLLQLAAALGYLKRWHQYCKQQPYGKAKPQQLIKAFIFCLPAMLAYYRRRHGASGLAGASASTASDKSRYSVAAQIAISWRSKP